MSSVVPFENTIGLGVKSPLPNVLRSVHSPVISVAAVLTGTNATKCPPVPFSAGPEGRWPSRQSVRSGCIEEVLPIEYSDYRSPSLTRLDSDANAGSTT
jgi:hypothetical protein